MKTVTQSINNPSIERTERPLLTFTRVIANAPSSIAFSGWGPRIK